MLDFSWENLKMIFEITESGTVVLKHFSYKDCAETEKSLRRSNIADIQIAGENQDDHHGGMHTGTYGGVTLKYVEHRFYDAQDGAKLEFKLKNEKMSATVHYQFYKGISAVRSWTDVTNISDDAIGLEYVTSFCYNGVDKEKTKVYIPHSSWVREADWQGYTLPELGMECINDLSTKRIRVSNTGTWSTKEHLPMAAMVSDSGAMMWQIENNGSWHWEIGNMDHLLYLKLSGPTEAENGWYKELAPGESFESVRACVAVGDSFDGALEQLTEYRRCIWDNSDTNRAMAVIFNDYLHCIEADPTAEKMIPVIDRAAEAGAEYYIMDAGWYADPEGTWWETVGEWKENRKRFPDGIKAVFDYVKSKGMIPGIWLEIEVMGIGCPLAEEFDDDCFFMRHGKRVIDHGRYQFDFSNPKVREYATSVVDRVVGEYGAGYIKFDYNIEAGAGTEVGSDSFGDGLLRHNRAYLGWIDSIRAKYPELILEDCSSGGLRADYAMLAHHHLLSATDQGNYKYIGYIAAAAPTMALPEQTAIWACPKADADEAQVAFNMTSAMLQRIHLSGKITELDEDKFALVKEAIKCYKDIRYDIPTGKPFYPIGLPKFGDDVACVAFRYDDCIRMCVWCYRDNMTISLPVCGKEAKIIYPSISDAKLKSVDNGFELSFPEANTSVVIEIK